MPFHKILYPPAACTDLGPPPSSHFRVDFFEYISSILFTHSLIHLRSALKFKEAELIEFFLANFATVCLNDISRILSFTPYVK